MIIYSLDRDYYTLKQYETIFADSDHKLQCFSYFYQLAEAIERTPPDVVFAESEFPTVCGLMKETLENHPTVRFILAGDALTSNQLALNPYGWIKKPIKKAKIDELMFRVKHPYLNGLFQKGKVYKP